MKRKIMLIFALPLLLILLNSNIANANYGEISYIDKNNFHQNGFRYRIQGWNYVHIEGEPYERGYQYGYLLASEILDMIMRCANFGHDIDFMKLYIRKSKPENYNQLSEKWWDILRDKSFKNYWKDYPDELKTEIKGIADGANTKNVKIFGRELDLKDILALNEFQNVWWGIKYFYKSIHPLRGFFNSIKELLLLITSKEIDSLHCSAFIATGNATLNGEIVVGHSTHFCEYIAERCNIILDIKPAQGNRFMMTTFPGAIWSNEDYYQNEKGIVLIETALPQGPWSRKGKNIGIRARTAIQYSDSIDQVIDNLKNGNNGKIPDEWLIGDIKTGEIASLELALFNTPVKRTFNDFYWSCNTPHDKKVRRELFGMIDLLPSLSNKYIDTISYGRVEKFEQLKDIYYGTITSEIGKIILAESPICQGMTDGKITDSTLIKDMGMLAFMGNPNGKTWTPTDIEMEKFHGATILPASGWVEIYCSNTNIKDYKPAKKQNDALKQSKILWQYKIKETEEQKDFSNFVSENIVYTSHPPGSLYALDAINGNLLWKNKFGEKTFSHATSEDAVYVGTDVGLYSIDKNSGQIRWGQLVGQTLSKPVILDNMVISSSYDGFIYGFDKETGNKIWEYYFPHSKVIAAADKNSIYVGSGKTYYKLNLESKTTTWEFKTEGIITASPKEYKNIIYFGSWDGRLYAIDCKSGEEKWNFKTGWGIDVTPAISKDQIFFGSNDNNFYALNKDTGEIQWYFNCKSAIHSSPVTYGEFVFFGSDDGRFYALNKTNGVMAWNFSPEYYIEEGNINDYITTPIISNPVVENGVVYLGVNGTVYALDSQTSETAEEELVEKDEINIFLVILLMISILIFIILIFHYKIKKIKDIFINNKKY